MKKIKICGLTRVEETEYVNRNHVDFAGFVLFFPKSKRNNTIEQAKQIKKHIAKDIQSVAVTVMPTLEQIREIEQAGFDIIQIHGEISTKIIEKIHIPVWKAFNVKDMAQFENYAGCDQITGYVFDANEPGSGKVFDWNLTTTIPRDGKLFLLAGGLDSTNVREAILAIDPDGVDVSSGVEFEDGFGKDPEKIDAFCRNVRTV